MSEHSYEEIRSVIFDIISGREKVQYSPSQYAHLKSGVTEVLCRREGVPQSSGIISHGQYSISRSDENLVLEMFWSLFREGIITLGCDSSNPQFPFFRVSHFGKTIIKNEQAYFIMMCLPIVSGLIRKSLI